MFAPNSLVSHMPALIRMQKHARDSIAVEGAHRLGPVPQIAINIIAAKCEAAQQP